MTDIDKGSLRERAVSVGLDFVTAKREAREAYEQWSTVAEALPEAEVATEKVRVLNLATADYIQVNEELNQHFTLDEQEAIARTVGEQAGFDEDAINGAIEAVRAAQQAEDILPNGDLAQA